ncbi:MAG: hypothetical protein FIB01_07850 [Gemmatimonadetes bacterium]|nr:hypothetical protein [Gemmatimonadota bacterium]
MAQQTGGRIRVTLRWIQIMDKMEPVWKEVGEFRFQTRVSTGAEVAEYRFPEKGHYEISDHPAWNKVMLNRVIYDGPAGDSLTVELMGEELDTFSANDLLDHYRREFTGPPDTWYGWYGPGEDVPTGVGRQSGDPELMDKWRVCYIIQPA